VTGFYNRDGVGLLRGTDWIFLYLSLIFQSYILIFVYTLPLPDGQWAKPGNLTKIVKVKVKCTLVQALRLCTGRTSHTGSRSITLLFLDHGITRGWRVSVAPRPLLTPRKDPVHIVQDAGWAPGPVWKGGKSRPPTTFHLRTVQPVASRYTDWATAADLEKECCFVNQGAFDGKALHCTLTLWRLTTTIVVVPHR